MKRIVSRRRAPAGGTIGGRTAAAPEQAAAAPAGYGDICKSGGGRPMRRRREH